MQKSQPNFSFWTWKCPIFLKMFRLWRQNVTVFFQMKVLKMDLCLNWEFCEFTEWHEMGVSRATHALTPFSGECPLGVLHHFKCLCQMIWQWSIHPLSIFSRRINWNQPLINRMLLSFIYWSQVFGTLFLYIYMLEISTLRTHLLTWGRLTFGVTQIFLFFFRGKSCYLFVCIIICIQIWVSEGVF